MTLKEALQILSTLRSETASSEAVFLACGFTPLHLQTFLAAHLSERLPDRSIQVLTGLYGDLPGNLLRAAEQKAAIAVPLEWPDIDPRLSFRQSGGWGALVIEDVILEAEARLSRILEVLSRAAQAAPVAVCGPTLPLPPVGHTRSSQITFHELKLRELVGKFLLQCAGAPGVRVVHPIAVDKLSPAAERFDIRTELFAGFPYRHLHASVLAALLSEALYPPQPKKGLVLDLDNTLWSGIVGEIGAENVCWDLSRKAQVHALLQQQAAAFAQNGVLVAIASKNDPSVATEALKRKDILIQENTFFPIEVNWGPKSESMRRILEKWNINADSVVFVDDSPMELAEVQSAFPAMECLQFFPSDPAKVLELLSTLKDLFGKDAVGEEDRIRAASLRSGAEFQQAAGEGKAVSTDFLASMKGLITIACGSDPSDMRAFELVNKTNQFNLNGRRYTETEWRSSMGGPAAFLAGISYEDKFGPLGKIAVVTGQVESETLRIDSWVMSCRAFSRRIEHQTIAWLFERFGVDKIYFDYRPTSRNMPLQEFWEYILGRPANSEGGVLLGVHEFNSRMGELPHTLVTIATEESRQAAHNVR